MFVRCNGTEKIYITEKHKQFIGNSCLVKPKLSNGQNSLKIENPIKQPNLVLMQQLVSSISFD